VSERDLPSPGSPTPRRRYVDWVIPAVALVLAIITFGDFGVTWDEQVQSTYGELSRQYFTSGFKDRRCNTFAPHINLYGPFFEMVCSTVSAASGAPKFAIRHLLTALAAVVAVVAVTVYGRHFKDRRVGIYSAAALLMLPRFVGHACINSKDIPFAAFFALAMAAFAALLVGGRRDYRSFLLCGAAAGLTLAVRVGGVLLFCLFAAGVLYTFLTRPRDVSVAPEKQKADARRAVVGTVMGLGIAWLLMVAFWPWAHENPLLNPIRAFLSFTVFPEAYPMLFQGRTVRSTELPGHYLVAYLLITTPIPLLLLAVVGVVTSTDRQIREPHSPDARLTFLAQLWLLLPILYFVLMRPNVYDGLRHFLFILPALAIFAGLGVAALFAWSGALKHGWVLRVVILVLLLLPVKDISRLHPYQMTYFNALVGGLREAGTRYETDYWVTSYKEAAEWLNDKVAAAPDRELRVLLAANAYSRICAEHYLDPSVRVVPTFDWPITGALPVEYDYYVAMTRYRFDENFPESPVVHTIGRDGAVFSVIRGAKPR
jgi:4-amino-4-deoxy-L-arabinose transferase-like glycosyltransferase